MKTFIEIHYEMVHEIYRSPDGWPENLTINDVSTRAAKEYAKQWVKYALESSHEVNVTGLVEMIFNEIDTDKIS